MNYVFTVGLLPVSFLLKQTNKQQQQQKKIKQIRRPNSVTIRVHTKELEYQVLAVLEFNSTRKRMSVVTRTPEGEIKIFSKGADTVILERLRKTDQPYVEATLGHLEAYAQEVCF